MVIQTIKKFNIGFTQVCNDVLNDKELSLRAKGIYAYLFSKPDGWEFHIEVMQNELMESKGQIYSAIKELIDLGYITRHQHNDNGKFGGTVYEFTVCGKTRTRLNRITENPNTNNTNINNTDNLNNTNTYNIKENKKEKKYRFEGKVIKLTDKDYHQWEVAFPDLNLHAELIMRDAYLSNRPIEEQKKWYISTSAFFIKENDRRKEQHEEVNNYVF